MATDGFGRERLGAVGWKIDPEDLPDTPASAAEGYAPAVRMCTVTPAGSCSVGGSVQAISSGTCSA